MNKNDFLKKLKPSIRTSLYHPSTVLQKTNSGWTLSENFHLTVSRSESQCKR
jgi:hypothetical protein